MTRSKDISLPGHIAQVLAQKDLDIIRVQGVEEDATTGGCRVDLLILVRLSMREDGAAPRPVPASVTLIIDPALEMVAVEYLAIRAAGEAYEPFLTAFGVPDADWAAGNPPSAPGPISGRLYEMHSDPEPHWMRVDAGVESDASPSRPVDHAWPEGTLLRPPVEAPLRGPRLFVAMSVPAEGVEGSVVPTVLGGLLGAGVALVIGGHPTVTPLLDMLVSAWVGNAELVEVHQLRRFPRSEHLTTLGPFIWHGVAPEGDLEPTLPPLDVELAEMRQAMVADVDAALFLGGAMPSESLSDPPGLRHEFDLFREAQPDAPALLSAMLGGYVQHVLIPAADNGEVETADGLDADGRRRLWAETEPRELVYMVLERLVAGRRGRG